MENAADALKMAVAFIVFAGAITVSLLVFGKARSTANDILYTKDKTNYYEYDEGKATERIISAETIIPTLYRYYKENYRIEFYKSSGAPLVLYYVQTTSFTSSDWINSAKVKSGSKVGIYYFDLTEESSKSKINGRWTTAAYLGSNFNNDAQYRYVRKNLEYFIHGTIDDDSKLANFKDGEIKVSSEWKGFLEWSKGKNFVEKLGITNNEEKDTDDNEVVTGDEEVTVINSVNITKNRTIKYILN